jgi:hypothetical protein
MEPDTRPEQTTRRRTKAVATAAGLLCVGALAGAMASAATTAGATTTTSGTTPTTGLAPPTAGTSNANPPKGTGPAGACVALPMSGTITAVGTSSVSIDTGATTTTYAVTNTSAIEKDGKATLGALAVGDTVHFSTVTSGGVTAIGTLIDGPPPKGALGGPGAPPGAGGPVPNGQTSAAPAGSP